MRVRVLLGSRHALFFAPAILAACFGSSSTESPDANVSRPEEAGTIEEIADAAPDVDASVGSTAEQADAGPDVDASIGNAAAVTVQPTTLDFGVVSCGGTAAAAAVTLTNGYAFDVAYTAAMGLGSSSPFTLDPSSGTVPASGQATLTVTPKAILAPSSTTPGAYDDTLTLTPNVPSVPPSKVVITESASGAILTVTMKATAFPLSVDGGPTSNPFTVTNTGNLDAPLTLSTTAGSGFTASFVGGATAAADGGMVAGDVTLPSDGGASGFLTVSTTAAQCGPAPARVAVSESVPVAAYATTPMTFDVDCGGAASPTQSLTITNSGTIPLVLSNVATSNGKVTVVSSPSSIAAGASGNVVLRASAVASGTSAAGTFGDTLSFVTNEAGSPKRTVSLAVRTHGANLAFVDVGGAPIPSSNFGVICATTSTYGVKNTGDLGVVVSGPEGGTGLQAGNAWVDLDATFASGVLVGAGQTVTATVSAPFEAQYACQDASGSVSFTFSAAGADGGAAAVCEPLPTLIVPYDYTMGQCPC